MLRRLGASAVLFGAAVSAAVALEAPSASDSGLHGIIGKEVPNDLGSELFAGLTGNWESWGKGLSPLVNKLYTDQKLDLAGQKALLKQLHEKIHTIDKALADPRFASLYGPLTGVRGHLARRVDIDQAILDTLELNPDEVKTAQIKEARTNVREALAALEKDLDKVPGGAAWLPYIHASQLRDALGTGSSGSVLATVEQKIEAGKNLKDPKQREFLARPAFVALAKAAAALRQAQEAKIAPTDEKALRPKLADLVSAIEGYEEEGTSAAGKKVREALAAADKVAIDGGDRLDEAIREHYLNYNLQIVASEAALSKLVNTQQTTTGPVTDFILGANVSGTETTTTNVTVDLLPGADAAQMELVLNGVTQSSTIGVTSQASIYTSGYHQFGAVKPLRFDGLTISTGPARMTYVQPSNTTTGASTSYSGMPIFGGIADRTAVREAEARRGQSEAIAAQRLESRVLPELDLRVDDMIKDANTRLQNDLRKRLGEGGVLPADVRARSNASYLRFSAQILGPGELAGDVTTPAGESSAGLLIRLHETLLNNAVNRMKFAGQTMTDAQVQAELERYLTLLTGRAIKLGNKKATSDKTSMLVFDKEDPIRFTIDNGDIDLVIRAGFKQEGKEDIPTQMITVPLHLSVQGDHVRVDRGTVQVAPATQTTDRTAQVVRAGVMKKKLESVIESSNLDGVIHVTRPGRPNVDLTIAKIGAESGWLSIWAN